MIFAKRRTKIGFLKRILILFLISAVVFIFLCINGPFRHPENNKVWGVTFSTLQIARMNMDWQEAYLAILNDLRPAIVRIPVYWNEIETKQGQYNLSSYYWMVQEAEERDISVVLVIGRRTPRWPECHAPSWLSSLNDQQQDEALLSYIKASVIGLKERPNLIAWQVENEPFLATFGECPELKRDLLKREINLVRNLDPGRKIIVTDSGELGDWARAASEGDIFGTTVYKKVSGTWPLGKYATYYLPAQFYRWKANLVSHFVPFNKLIISELQGEPWVIGTPTATEKSLEEQYETVNPEYFKEIVKYAKATGIGEIYWWGSEWWYWLKLQGHDEIWQIAKTLFSENQ